MDIPFLDLRRVNEPIMSDILRAAEEVFGGGWYITGSKVTSFERNMAAYLAGSDGMGYTVGCNSGTDALILSLLAAGVGVGDEVLTVSHTAIPTVAAICAVGATPVFLEIDPETWLMDISSIESKTTPRTKAIIPVHLYGNMVDVQHVREHLKKTGHQDVAIIEDVAQAHGSFLRGVQAGCLGDIAAFSFYPSKNIGALGDGGAIFTRSERLYNDLLMLRNYGQTDRYNATRARGINSRLDEVQAAILDIKLGYLNMWNRRKQEMVEFYRRELEGCPVRVQKTTDGCDPAWHLCVIALETPGIRDALMRFLEQTGIQTLIHYPIPTHRQNAFKMFSSEALPVTENLAGRILSLPMNIALDEDTIKRIIAAIKQFYKTSAF